jgi:hypothetical protein
MKKTTLLLIILTAVCANAEWTFDNDKEVQERVDKRDEEREEARKALERVRFGVKGGGGAGGGVIGETNFTYGGEVGIMINIPLSRLKDGNLVLATELNIGSREVDGPSSFGNILDSKFEETYLNIPLTLQYVSFFYPATDVQVHWVPSPKRHVFMHLKTIMEAGAFIDIPLGTTISGERGYYPTYDYFKEDYKDRNSYDIGGIVGYSFQLENIILGLRVAANYTDFGGSSLLLQGKLYFGYLF